MTPFTQFIKSNIKTGDLIGVEVGVFTGQNAAYLLQDLPIKKLYLIDNYKPYWDGGMGHYSQERMDKCYAEAIGLFKQHHHFIRTMFIIQDSVWASKLFSDNELDFVYIDAGHTYDEVMSDLNAWWPKVRVGGVAGGHDYGTINGLDVKKAVDEFLKTKGIIINNKDPEFLYHDPDPDFARRRLSDASIGLRIGEAMEWAIVKP